MPTLSPTAIADLLEPYLFGKEDAPDNVASLPAFLHTQLYDQLYDQLAIYLELLLRWNARTNLTAIRSPEEIVQRHFGESLFAARHLPASATLLDLGSGAGFPGLPIQLLNPNLAVHLAESQNKKASFLREVIRTLGLPTRVWAARAETLPPGTHFDSVALRAVDRMDQALNIASTLATRHLLLLTTIQQAPLHLEQLAVTTSRSTSISIPGTQDGIVLIIRHPS